ncbi:MAG: hypothetical protein GY832_45130, partial [Chloroflexi bacterium]|nr:hypothetical protein [Chloroflexota bacterium]
MTASVNWSMLMITSSRGTVTVRLLDPGGLTEEPPHWPDWVEWTVGAIWQFSSDMLGGFPDALANTNFGHSWKRGCPDAAQEGMLFGRMLSQSVAVVMTADGTVKVVTGIAAILATGGGGVALAPATCGASIVVAGMAIPIEALLVLEGAGEIAWAQVVFAAAKKHPVGGGSSSRR